MAGILAIVLIGLVVMLAKNMKSDTDSDSGGMPLPNGDILNIKLTAFADAAGGSKPGITTLFVNGKQIKTYQIAAMGNPGSAVMDQIDLRSIGPVDQVTFVRQDPEEEYGKILIEELSVSGVDMKPGLYRVSPDGGNMFMDDPSRSSWVRQGSMTWHPAVYRWNAMGVPQFT